VPSPAAPCTGATGRWSGARSARHGASSTPRSAVSARTDAHGRRRAGKEARTRYEVQRSFVEPVVVTELACTLETGRTHQIRVHLRSIGHPVVGDLRYGGARQSLPMQRPFLHAELLELAHPVTGEPLVFRSPLPGDLDEILRASRQPSRVGPEVRSGSGQSACPRAIAAMSASVKLSRWLRIRLLIPAQTASSTHWPSWSHAPSWCGSPKSPTAIGRPRPRRSHPG